MPPHFVKLLKLLFPACRFSPPARYIPIQYIPKCIVKSPLALTIVFILISTASVRQLLATDGQPSSPIGSRENTPIQAGVNPAAIPQERASEPWWIERHKEKLAQIRQGQVDLVFIGDSITQNWERNGPLPWGDFRPIWTKYYGSRHALNLGFAGDTTANLLWRFNNGELEGIAPRVAVVLIGANNTELQQWSADQTAKGFDAVIENLHNRLPNTKILLLGILPSDRSTKITETNLAINSYLAKKYQHSKVLTYLDISQIFIRDGKPDRTLYYEAMKTPPGRPLHPNVEGQEKMAEAIEPVLARLMGEKRTKLFNFRFWHF